MFEGANGSAVAAQQLCSRINVGVVNFVIRVLLGSRGFYRRNLVPGGFDDLVRV